VTIGLRRNGTGVVRLPTWLASMMVWKIRQTIVIEQRTLNQLCRTGTLALKYAISQRSVVISVTQLN